MTRTQQRIYKLLSDWKPHTRKELHGCLPDELSSEKTVSYHVSKIRKHIKPKGQDIVCRVGEVVTYRLFRFGRG